MKGGMLVMEPAEGCLAGFKSVLSDNFEEDLAMNFFSIF
jgi:hypothetical protein